MLIGNTIGHYLAKSKKMSVECAYQKLGEKKEGREKFVKSIVNYSRKIE